MRRRAFPTSASPSAVFRCTWEDDSQYAYPHKAAALDAAVSGKPSGSRGCDRRGDRRHARADRVSALHLNPHAGLDASFTLMAHPEFWPTTLNGRLNRSSWGLVRTLRVSGITRAFFLQQYWKSRVGRCDVGSVVWRSSLAMSHCLPALAAAWRAERAGRRQPRVLELGCGAGCLVGMSVALRGWSVTATDLPHIVGLARQNVANNLAGRGWVRLQALPWGDRDAAARITRDYGPFDVVVAADVLYSPDLHEALAVTLSALGDASARALPSPPELWLAWERRHARCEAAFFARMATAGFAEPRIVDKALMHAGYRACSVAIARIQL